MRDRDSQPYTSNSFENVSHGGYSLQETVGGDNKPMLPPNMQGRGFRPSSQEMTRPEAKLLNSHPGEDSYHSDYDWQLPGFKWLPRYDGV